MEEKYCKLIKKTIKALDNNDVCTREMRETAIQAMKEVQQYHKLGTIEQCNEARIIREIRRKNERRTKI